MLMTELSKYPSLARTFPVDDVIPAADPHWTEALHGHLETRFLRRVLFLPESGRQVVNTGWHPRGPRPFVPKSVNRCHPLIDAVGTAFAEHRPLTLSPDAIWLVIQQGFSHHITENAELFRGRLVSHQGSRELAAKLSSFEQADLQAAIADFSTQIRENTDPILHDHLLCDFSTTTPIIRTASQVALMDCFSSYFKYHLLCVCGIPSITLTGSVEDWQRMRGRVDLLATFDLEWWTSRLLPILDQLIRTAEGLPDLAFWQAIYKPRRSYDSSVVTGWIGDLFPYLGDAPKRYRNRVFNYERVEWSVARDEGVSTGRFNIPGVDRKSFPSGLSSVPLKFDFPHERSMTADLVAGFLALEQDPETQALSPLISWSITERPPETPVFV